jgi:hypothetical protein
MVLIALLQRPRRLATRGGTRRDGRLRVIARLRRSQGRNHRVVDLLQPDETHRLACGSGTSSRSFWLRAGSSTVVMPARVAASTFSFTPPIGSTRPRSEISPVIATSLRAVRPVSIETSATNMATPALGPSFGMAPAGTWM